MSLCWASASCAHCGTSAGWCKAFSAVPLNRRTALEVAFVLFNLIILCLNVNSFWNRGDMKGFLNKLVDTNAKLKTQFIVPESKEAFKDGCGIYIRLLTPASFNMESIVGFFFAIEPHSRMYFYNWLPVEKSTWTMTCYGVWKCFITCWQMGIIFAS